MRFETSKLSGVFIGKIEDRMPGPIVDVERWWDAKTVALLHFGGEPDELRYEVTSKQPHVETRWIGIDNGGALGRRMQWRVAGNKRWLPVDEYNKDSVVSAMER